MYTQSTGQCMYIHTWYVYLIYMYSTVNSLLRCNSFSAKELQNQGLLCNCQFSLYVRITCIDILSTYTYNYVQSYLYILYCYGVATIRRLLQMIGLFCRISSLLQGSFAEETYNFKEPTNRSHPRVSSTHQLYCRPYIYVLIHVSTCNLLTSQHMCCAVNYVHTQ